MSCSEKFHILEIRDLSVSFRQYDKGTRQVDLPVISRLNVAVHEGEIVAVVGSSGSGKSLLAHAVMGLLPSNARCGGDIYFLQEPLTPKRLAHIRGKEIALVPQSVTFLDPLMLSLIHILRKLLCMGFRIVRDIIFPLLWQWS